MQRHFFAAFIAMISSRISGASSRRPVLSSYTSGGHSLQGARLMSWVVPSYVFLKHLPRIRNGARRKSRTLSISASGRFPISDSHTGSQLTCSCSVVLCCHRAHNCFLQVGTRVVSHVTGKHMRWFRSLVLIMLLMLVVSHAGKP